MHVAEGPAKTCHPDDRHVRDIPSLKGPHLMLPVPSAAGHKNERAVGGLAAPIPQLLRQDMAVT